MLQILREWPPGFGGIERVAHQLGIEWEAKGNSCSIYSLNKSKNINYENESINIPYRRTHLSSLILGKLIIPLPSRKLIELIFSKESIHAHLPCPGVLSIIVLSFIINSNRKITVHWHSFLKIEPSIKGLLIDIYQKCALNCIKRMRLVVTTSPTLIKELEKAGCNRSNLHLLPCCLDERYERDALSIQYRKPLDSRQLRVIFIGRLDSYKRVDWLFESLTHLNIPWKLDVIGIGPDLQKLKRITANYPVNFHGPLNERQKLNQLSIADLLVLPSDRCNEAFGIVQLEAMASGIPSLAFSWPRSGMNWVSKLPSLNWSHNPSELSSVIRRIASDPDLLLVLGKEARDRYELFFSRAIWKKKFKRLVE